MSALESRAAVIVAPSLTLGLSKPRQIAPEATAPTSVHGPPVDVAYWSLSVWPAAKGALASAESRMRTTSVSATPLAAVLSAASAAVGCTASAFWYQRYVFCVSVAASVVISG